MRPGLLERPGDLGRSHQRRIPELFRKTVQPVPGGEGPQVLQHIQDPLVLHQNSRMKQK